MTAWNFFWIDALCIDQESVAKRNYQVNMMRQIFAAAAFVIVWLGPQSVDSQLAMDVLRSSYAPQGFKPRYQIWADQSKRKAFFSLLERDYWKRVWVIQEVKMASGILILCGEQELLWRELDSFITELRFTHEQGSAFTIIQEKRQALIWKSEGKRTYVSIFEFIYRYHEQECTDPRDRVYGLLGLVLEEGMADSEKKFYLQRARARGLVLGEGMSGSENNLKLRADYSLSTSELLDKLMNRDEAFLYADREELKRFLRKVLRLDHNEQHSSSSEVKDVAKALGDEDFDWEKFVTHDAT